MECRLAGGRVLVWIRFTQFGGDAAVCECVATASCLKSRKTRCKPVQCDGLVDAEEDQASNALCRNLIKKPWAYNAKTVGFIQGTRIKAQGFLIRFLHYACSEFDSGLQLPQARTFLRPLQGPHSALQIKLGFLRQVPETLKST